ncbi:hypothetical protein IMSHALPRED_009921 [Imshaugia aleurites]|uniref:Uncharacterized protein n=1 Tax=Imshaugia aleurites TaxID=172621 RepID=A0A8H3EQY8_9LECA|nr:hypothetical protein IMSHALPRED_009921 [Imshaugia aleurites]
MLNRMSSSGKKRESMNVTSPQNAGETFTFSAAPGNLDPYTHSDQPPYFDLRKCPSMASVIALRHYLSLSRNLPNEIIDMILDLAEYWPHSSSILDMTTRVYSGHMCYGSYPARPRQKLGRLLSTPESRREWKENGFLIRTPPLGWYCVSETDPPKQHATNPSPTTHPRAKSKPLIPIPPPPTWLPPRGVHPARRVVFEILSREERPENTHKPGSTFCYASSKTSFDATVDTISFPKTTKRSVNRGIDPLLWTADAATTHCINHQPPDVCYAIRSKCPNPAQSSSSPSSFASASAKPKPKSKSPDAETHASGVTKNYTAHNRKVVRTWRYDGAERCYLPTTDRDFGSEDATEFVRGLREGDCVGLWARARRSGERRRRLGGAWCNVVDRVAIHVFWAV